MTKNHRWSFGDKVLLRGVWQGKLWFAIVAYMVQDTDLCDGWESWSPPDD